MIRQIKIEAYESSVIKNFRYLGFINEQERDTSKIIINTIKNDWLNWRETGVVLSSWAH